MEVEDLTALQALVHGLEGTDRPYTFYYDETNNIRRLHLTNTGFNVAEPACFLLGGIGHDGPPRPLGLDALRPKLHLQANMAEIKLKYLAKGDFLACLKSAPIANLLEWIESEGLFLHYQVTDPLYWSIVDIIDSIEATVAFGFDMLELRALKNGLYALLRGDLGTMSGLLRRYDYPNVGDRKRPFLDELIALVDIRLSMLDEEDVGDHVLHMMLKGVLQAGRDVPLPFLEDEKPLILIEEFGIFFANRMQTFARSDHILDDEHLVSEYLESGASSGQALSYRFANSRDEEGIQISDVVVGLLGKAFTYCTRHSMSEIEHDLARLSDRQACALATLARLLDRSTTASNAFALHILSNDDEARVALLLAPDR